ncbi:UvrD-helicase domain-containing protein [Patescibacteria group bacterium]|nr:UvrD-helicase domain-containing protein [Patescibacteria group bacterium]
MIFKGLNQKQIEAVSQIDGPVLIIAGPGSGKTRVLTHRVAYLIEQGIGPEQILAVTFTNKAANEMRERIAKLISLQAKRDFKLPTIGTFHAVCAKWLRSEAKKLGYQNDFVIFDAKDSQTMVKQSMKDLNISEDRFNPAAVAATISQAKNELQDTSTFANEAFDFWPETVAKIYTVYQERLQQANAMDFDDLIMLMVKLWQEQPEVLAKYQEKFRYIMVDECLPYDAPVLLADGASKAIGEIVENKKSVSVLTFNPATKKQEAKTIIGWKKTPVGNRKILKITVAKRCHKRNRYKTKYKKLTIRNLVCTSNHRVYANDKFIPAKMLKIGDELQWESSFTRFNLKVCDECQKVYRTHKMHEARHKAFQKIICPQCKAIYKTKFQYTIHLNKHTNPNYKRKYKLSLAGLRTLRQNMNTNNPMSNEKIRSKAGKSRSLYWAKLSPEERDKKLKRFINLPVFSYDKLPTAPEKIIINFKISGLIYSGKGDRWVTLKNGKHKCPDFMSALKRKIIEVGDFEYWHTKKEAQKLKKLYKQIGFDCLYLDAKKVLQSPQKTKVAIEKFLDDCPTPVDVIDIQEIKISDKFVYDITTADNHNFYANGILVHNCQDTNHSQYILTKQLAQKYKNLCFIGDLDQSIYGWRGADFRNILNFEKDYPDAKVILLEQNYRSTQNILNAAHQVIIKNKNRKEKELWTANPQGHRITVFGAQDEREEGHYIIQEITRHQKTNPKLKLSDFSVLYRTNAQSRALEEAFLKTGLPYKVVGTLKFYDRREIKDMLAYLRLIQNPRDVVAMERIINVPARGFGKDVNCQELISLFDAKTFSSPATDKPTPTISLSQGEARAKLSFGEKKRGRGDENQNTIPLQKMTPQRRRAWDNFSKLMEELRAAAKISPLSQLLKLVIDKTKYEDYINDRTEEGRERWENLKELFTVTKKYDALLKSDFSDPDDLFRLNLNKNPPNGLQAFLEEAALMSNHDEVETHKDLVNLMTLHCAKGLEWPVVFMAGLEDGIFPHSRSLIDFSQMEEERRLCYVGITRAKEKLYLIAARLRNLFGSTTVNPPSRFLNDLPPHLVEFINFDNNETDGEGIEMPF